MTFCLDDSFVKHNRLDKDVFHMMGLVVCEMNKNKEQGNGHPTRGEK